MSASEDGDAIESHGTALDEEKNRVKCKYCDKVVRGFNRLKHHLGGVGTDVVACPQVPDDIKQFMRNVLLEKKKERLLKEVGKLYHPDLPLKRNFSPPSSEIRRCQPKPNHATNSENENLASAPTCEEFSNQNVSSSNAEQSQIALSDKRKNAMELSCQEGGNDSKSIPVFVKIEDEDVVVKEEVKDDTTLAASKCIGRFFFEAGIDLNSIKLPSFQRMVDAAISCGFGFKVPRYDELKGWILEADLNEVQGRVEAVKRSWEQTGCSILLDCWTDQRGRSLISFLADCPQGTIFLRSVDASNAVMDVDALFLLLSKVIEEVGIRNVVQVITHDSTCYMEAAGKKLVEKYKTIFWTLCTDHCINLILERIADIEPVKKVLTEAKAITRFIYSHALPLELMRKHIRGRELVRTSRLKSAAPFITLENIMSEKENLMYMFNSSTWNMSTWAYKTKGKTICAIVKNPAFWASVAGILKVTNPLIGVLHQINGSDTAPLGFLYDTMDRAKIEISRNLGGEEARYDPFWMIIDNIWNHHLHSPLHAAGYYLNPSIFYSNDFFVDAEVTTGLLYCFVRILDDQQSQELVVMQLDAYREALGGFAEIAAVHQRSTVPPANWWELHGGESSELQNLAIRILSQTCSTAARYKLRKSLSEQLHAKGRNCIEQQKFADMEFVHNNLRLWNSPYSKDHTDNFGVEDLNPMDDWIVDG